MPAAPPTDTDPPATPPAPSVEAADEDGTRNIGKPKPKNEAVARRIQRRHALLVGVCEYQNSGTFSPLRYPAKDVAAMRDLLIGYGYSPVTWLDDTVGQSHLRPTRANILRAVQELCKEAQPDDLIWIHFSGHGLRWARPSGGEARLLAVQDTKAADPLSTGIDIDEELVPMLRASPARQKVMSLDACHLGYTGSRAASDGTDPLPWLLGQGLAILTASDSKQYAHESNTVGMGVFTNFLIDTLREKVNKQQLAPLAETAKSVLSKVTDWYRKHGRLPQWPALNFEGIGEILLVDLRPDIVIDPTLTPIDDLHLQVPNLQLTVALPRPPICAANYLAQQYVEGSAERPNVVATLVSRDFVTQQQYRQLHDEFPLRLAKFAKLKHEGVARFLTQGVVADFKRPFFVTEFLEGKQLSEVLPTLRLSYPDLISRLTALASAMTAAHQAGLVHGSLNPDKVVDTGASWKIVDLPVTAIDVQLRLTEHPEEPRPSHYAPELTPASPIPTEECDVYALGCLMNQLLDLPSPKGTLRNEADQALRGLIDQMRLADPLQRPKMAQVAAQLQGLLDDLRREPLVVRQGGFLLRIGGVILGLCALAYGVVKLTPDTPPKTQDMAPVKGVDLAKPRDDLQEAREVLRAALADHTDTDLPIEAARSIGWASDTWFSGTLDASLQRADAFPEVRRWAAWALGRFDRNENKGKGIGSLQRLVKATDIDLTLWREALGALVRLKDDPSTILNTDIGREYLTESENNQRKLIALSLFAATDPASRKELDERVQAMRGDAPDSAQEDAEAFALLSLARSPNTEAQQKIAKRLAFKDRPSETQVRLALAWVTRDDRTGIDVLHWLIKHKADAGGLGPYLSDAYRLVARREPTVERCKQVAQEIRKLPSPESGNLETDEFHGSLGVLPACAEPAKYIHDLLALMSPTHPRVGKDRVLPIYAAANVIEIKLSEEKKRSHPQQPDLGASSKREEAVVSHVDSAFLVSQHGEHSQTALDSNAKDIAREVSARQMRVERVEMEERRDEPPVKEYLTSAEVSNHDKALLDMKVGGSTIDQVVAVHGQHDQKVVAEWQEQAGTQPLAVQQALAERIPSPQSTEYLRKELANGGKGSLRAFGELRRRGVQVTPPKRDLITEYESGSADQRLDLVDSMSGWPFAEAKPVLYRAIKDGSAPVQRSAVRILGKAVSNPETKADALSLLRLVIGDADETVRTYLKAILNGQGLSASEMPEAPVWPPPVQPKPVCPVTITADDKGVVIDIVDSAKARKPYSLQTRPFPLTLSPGKYEVRYLNEHGEEISMPFVCNHNEPVPLRVPISALGQKLGKGVQRLGSKQLQAAQELFTKVQNQLTDDVIKKILDPSARKRAEDVRALSDYYLGRVLYDSKSWVEAHSHFAAFRQSQHDKGQDKRQLDAKEKRDFLQAEKLGGFKIRLEDSNKKCQTFTVWGLPGNRTVRVDMGKGQPPRMLGRKFLSVGVVTEGDHECPR